MNKPDHDQRTSEWEAWRQQGIGASDMAAILHNVTELKKYASPWMKPRDLFEIKRGKKKASKGTMQPRGGIDSNLQREQSLS